MSGINGMLQYQWGQSGLTAQTGTSITTPNATGTLPSPPSGNPTTPIQNQTGVSPNDGYSTTGIGQNAVQNVRCSFQS
jgi:mannan endo-1,4-beta-mannosidase